MWHSQDGDDVTVKSCRQDVTVNEYFAAEIWNGDGILAFEKRFCSAVLNSGTDGQQLSITFFQFPPGRSSAWLERCVRDAEVACSNHVAPTRT